MQVGLQVRIDNYHQGNPLANHWISHMDNLLVNLSASPSASQLARSKETSWSLTIHTKLRDSNNKIRINSSKEVSNSIQQPRWGYLIRVNTHILAMHLLLMEVAISQIKTIRWRCTGHPCRLHDKPCSSYKRSREPMTWSLTIHLCWLSREAISPSSRAKCSNARRRYQDLQVYPSYWKE